MSVLSENSLSRIIRELKDRRKPGLSFYLTAGYPTMKKFMDIIKFLDDEHLADFVEIGIPFSDPVADGPVIQAASETAIKKGASFRGIIERFRLSKEKINIPYVLMTYMNPVIAGNMRQNVKMAAGAGFSAMIIPDLPIEEADEYLKLSKKEGVSIVFLSAPATGNLRIRKISKLSSPFLYYVSRYGITGTRNNLSYGIKNRIIQVKKYSEVPVYCGFGISNPSQAGVVAEYADGIIIGSAIIKIINEYPQTYFKEIKKFAINVRKELEKCRKKTGSHR